MQKIISEIKSLWEALPKEVKVALYIAVSKGMSDLITQLGKVQINNVYLMIVFNILLVFLAELKPRIDKMRGK